MKRLNNYINEQKSKFTNALLHKLFDNDKLDQNNTIIELIDKYCKDGGEVLYECQDEVMMNPTDEFKVDSAMVQIPETDIIYKIDVYKSINQENAYTIYIQGETLIIIIGNPMKTLQEHLELEKAINEAEESELYKYIQEAIQKSIETGKSVDELIDEGILSGLLGGIGGATVGPAIMKAVCKALGISENSALGNLLTSRTVLAAVGANLGFRI